MHCSRACVILVILRNSNPTGLGSWSYLFSKDVGKLSNHFTIHAIKGLVAVACQPHRNVMYEIFWTNVCLVARLIAEDRGDSKCT